MTFLKNYFITLLRITAVILLASFIFSSCKKDKDEVVPPSPAAGKWVGYFSMNGIPTGDLAFLVKEGGVLEAQNTAGQKTGNGSWTLTGATFRFNYTTTSSVPAKFSFIGTLENSTKLSGAWGNGESTVNGGFWNVSKKQ